MLSTQELTTHPDDMTQQLASLVLLLVEEVNKTILYPSTVGKRQGNYLRLVGPNRWVGGTGVLTPHLAARQHCVF